VAHHPFAGKHNALHKNQDIEGDQHIIEKIESRMKIAETDEGRDPQTRVNDLMDLLAAFRSGAVTENHEE
jgi:fructose-1,6-bisphosphatase-3